MLNKSIAMIVAVALIMTATVTAFANNYEQSIVEFDKKAPLTADDYLLSAAPTDV